MDDILWVGQSFKLKKLMYKCESRKMETLKSCTPQNHSFPLIPMIGPYSWVGKVENSRQWMKIEQNLKYGIWKS